MTANLQAGAMERSLQERGVFYATADYIGVARRFAIDVVDVLVASVASAILAAVVAFLVPEVHQPFAVLLTWIGVWFAYFVLLKRSRFRTAGYLLTGARIVSLQGDVPSVGSLTMRLMFAAFGPLNVLFDLFWISSDPWRQALRDKFAHTYVVRRGAEPAGAGIVRYAHYTVFGASFLFQEVVPVVSAGASGRQAPE